MKTYEVLIDSRTTNQYVNGRISGIIYMLTGMPEIEMAWGEEKFNTVMPFKATEEQSKAVHECLNKMYAPKFYVGIREVE